MSLNQKYDKCFGCGAMNTLVPISVKAEQLSEQVFKCLHCNVKITVAELDEAEEQEIEDMWLDSEKEDSVFDDDYSEMDPPDGRVALNDFYALGKLYPHDR